MAAPSGTFVRPDLGLAFSEFDLLSATKGYIGTQVLPLFDAALQSASFSILKLKEMLADIDLKRAPGGGYPEDDWEFDQDSFQTVEYGHIQRIDDRERAIFSYTIDIEGQARNRAMIRAARGLERRIADSVFNATTFSSYTTAVTAPWSTASTGTPIDDVKAAMIAVRNRIGEIPNALICDWETALNIANCDQVTERLKFWGGDDPSITGLKRPEVLARVLGIDRVIIAGGMRNSADKGQAASLTALWPKTKAMVAKIATSNDLMEPCIGRAFQFTGDGASGEFGVVDSYRDDPRRSDVIRVRHDTHEKIIYAAAGQFLTTL